jgi:hypothetical protein
MQSGMACVAENVAARALGVKPQFRVIEGGEPPDVRQPLEQDSKAFKNTKGGCSRTWLDDKLMSIRLPFLVIAFAADTPRTGFQIGAPPRLKYSLTPP